MRQRARLTPAILAWGLLDAVGMALFASGAAWLAQGHALLIEGLPGSVSEAASLLVVGAGVMFFAATRILRELLKQRPGEADTHRPGAETPRPLDAANAPDRDADHK